MMGRREQTTTYLKSRLSYCPETGVFKWKHNPDAPRSWNARFAGKDAGTKDRRGYIKIMMFGVCHYAHRLAWLFQNGKLPPNDIDHRNCDKSDNRIQNLREATRAQNMYNTASRPSKNVFPHYNSNGYHVVIRANGERKYIGSFRTEPEAINAARKAREEMHGEYANHGDKHG